VQSGTQPARREHMSLRSIVALVAFTGLIVPTVVACTTEPPAEEIASATSEVTTATNVSRALAYGKSLIGTPYGWWYSGGIPAGEPMWAASGAPPSYIGAANCAGLTNLMLRSVGKDVPGYGGTGSYGDYYWDVSEYFDPNRDYPPGTLIGRYFRDSYDQGHVAVVIEGGYVLQSYPDYYGGSYPGVNDWWTVAESHDGYYYEYAVLPQNWLGGGGSSSSECAYGDGWYCGGNGVSGDAQTLYHCSGGSASVYERCANGCAAQAAYVDDYCN
jgi:hypothetical protein